MRKSNSLKIEHPNGEKSVAVLEMTVADMLAAPSILGLVCTGDVDMLVLSLAMGQAGEEGRNLLPKISDLGESISEVGGSSLLRILRKWAEVNTDFFGNLRTLWEAVNAAPAEKTPKEQAA
ncbi:hypothetical protein DesfrDRAFT_0155 [Solidesulfovibrio fructosivorans JJ]]|uniref:Uncharacterized protein n=1 Tax=Solidesulfovibrio fructosivorans JJ] TaxID=596151 RepID=E1JRA6_SOLFR|nr:hypothetical protein [Solidesulfovibrio fructosivorans]EFL53107.1 hypothetical protein DesfrDRAFT_0155 [Solidesulfovibrio fructosivorans JJ]]